MSGTQSYKEGGILKRCVTIGERPAVPGRKENRIRQGHPNELLRGTTSIWNTKTNLRSTAVPGTPSQDMPPGRYCIACSGLYLSPSIHLSRHGRMSLPGKVIFPHAVQSSQNTSGFCWGERHQKKILLLHMNFKKSSWQGNDIWSIFNFLATSTPAGFAVSPSFSKADRLAHTWRGAVEFCLLHRPSVAWRKTAVWAKLITP